MAAVSFSAIVLAADRTAADPVAQAAGVCCKALSPVGGQPMVLRVLEALAASRAVSESILCGPGWEAVCQEAQLQAGIEAGRWRWLEPASTPSASASKALQTVPPQSPVLLTAADHALLTPSMVDYFCSQALGSGCDIVVALARYAQVSDAYPQVRRTALKFRDAAYCGCNLFALLTPESRPVADFWRRVESQRKKPWRVMGALGWVAVLRYLLGWLTLEQGLEGLSRRLAIRAGAVIMPFPEAAIDVDTVEDWRFVQEQVGAP